MGYVLKTLEHLGAIIILVLVAVVSTVLVYLLVPSLQSTTSSSVSSGERKTRCVIKVEAVKPKPGFVTIDVYSSCDASVDTVYFLDPVTNDAIAVARLDQPVRLQAGTYTRIVVPLLGLGVNITEFRGGVRIALGSTTGQLLYSVDIVNPYLAFKKAVENAWLVLLADRHYTDPYTLDAYRTQWVFFNYVTGDYIFYAYDDAGTLHGPYRGRAPIIKGASSFLVQCDWCSWNERPIDSPIVIVYNPTKAAQDWKFTLITPHPNRTLDFLYCYENVFEVPKLVSNPSEVVYDILIFWEDQWNPYLQPDLDDWKDHVVRVTIFANATARIQVYVAKGAYLHVFAHRSSTAIASQFPLELCPSGVCEGFCQSQPTSLYDYCKSHGATWGEGVEQGEEYNPTCQEACKIYLYQPDPSKVWYVQLG